MGIIIRVLILKKICKALILIRKHLDLIVAAMVLFILFSPQGWWDGFYGSHRFDHYVFAAVTLLLIIVCIADAAEKRRAFPAWLRENTWLALYSAALVLSVVFSTDPRLSLSLLTRCLSGLFVVYIINSGEFTYGKIRRIFGIVTVGVLITAVYAIIQRIQGVAPNKSFTDLTVHTSMPGRVYSFFDNPVVYAFALAPLLLVAAAYALGGKTRSRAAVGAISFALGCAALLMTYSRGAWLGFAAGAFLVTVLCKPKLTPVLLILGALALIPESIRERALSVFNQIDQSVRYRSLLSSAGLDVIKSRPVFGAGLGLDTVKNYVLENSFWHPIKPEYVFPHTHNLPVQVWCEMGIFGFTTFFGAVFHNIIRAMRSLRGKDMATRVFVSSLIAGVAAMLVFGIADYPFSYSRIMMLFWILFGLLASVRKIDS